MPPDLTDLRSVMKRLHVSRKTVMRLVEIGSIRSLKVGRQWRFDPRDIDAYIDREKTKAITSNDDVPYKRPGADRYR